MQINIRKRLRTGATHTALELGTRSDGAPLDLDLDQFDRSVLVTGPTGTGKTRLLRQINLELAAKAPHVCQVIIGPKGSYAADLRRDYYRRGWRRRVTFANLGERRRIVGINLLRRWGNDELQAKGARDTLMRAMRIMELSEMPSLARWSYAALYGAVASGMTLAEAGRLVEVDDGGIRAAIIRRLPPSVARQDLEVLESMGEHFRRSGASGAAAVLRFFDDQLGSTLRRLRFLRENPLLHLMLGTQRALSWDRQLRSGHTTIVDANLGDALDEEDQRHLVLGVVADVTRTCFTRAPRERVRVVLTIDEVGRFPSMVLAEINDRGREMGLSVVAAHQFLGQFDDPKHNDRRLRDSFLADTGVKIIFGALPPADARELSALAFEHHLDPDTRQLELRSPRQLSRVIEATSETRGISRSLTHSRTVAHTDADGEAESASDTVSTSEMESQGSIRVSGHVVTASSGSSLAEGVTYLQGLEGATQRTIGEAASQAVSQIDSEGESTSAGSSTSESHTDSLSTSHVEADTYAEGTARTRGRSRSRTRGLMVVPTEVFEEVTSVQFEPLATQLHRRTAALINQPPQHAHLVVGKEPPVPFRVADVPDPPLSEHQAFVADLDMWNDHPGVFSTPEEIAVEIEERQRQLVAEVPPGELVDVDEDVAALPTREEFERRLGLRSA